MAKQSKPSGNGKKPRRPRQDNGEWHEPFLAALRATANVRLACQEAKVARQVSYRHRERNEGFALAWRDALDDACDSLEATARSRALKTSDTLLIFLLKSHRPEVYGDRFRADINVDNQVRIQEEGYLGALLRMKTKDVPEPGKETPDEPPCFARRGARLGRSPRG